MKNNILKIAFIMIIVAVVLILIGWSLQMNRPITENANPENVSPTSIEKEVPQSVDETIAEVNQFIDHGDYTNAEELLSQLKSTNSEDEIVYVTYSKLYSSQKKYHAAKSILLEGKQNAKTMQDINEQLGIVDEKIDKGESMD